MKIRILTILLSVFSVFTFAQITVTDADLLEIGDVIYLANDDNTIVNALINYDSKNLSNIGNELISRDDDLPSSVR